MRENGANRNGIGDEGDNAHGSTTRRADEREAAQGNASAETAWREFHQFIEAAKDAVVGGFGRGLYIDLHGHGHDNQRLEIGYLLRAADLERSDALLDDANLVHKSSIRALVGQSSAGFVELVRGAASMGGLLQPLGYPTVPGPTQPDPGGEPYFTGGYNTARHGSRNGGTIKRDADRNAFHRRARHRSEPHCVCGRAGAGARGLNGDPLSGGPWPSLGSFLFLELTPDIISDRKQNRHDQTDSNDFKRTFR